MRVYRIEFPEYEYKPGVFGGGVCHSDYFLTNTTQKHVMADNALEAVDLPRAGSRSRIEIASIEHVCKVETKK